MAKKTLLLVDGDARSLRVLEVSLRKAGYNLTTCASCAEVLEALEYSTPDLIVSDTRLPDRDGFQLVEDLRKSADWASIPFMFLSSDTSVESKVKGLQLGVEDYLTKPIYTKEILARIHLALQRRERDSFARGRNSISKTRFTGSLEDMGLVDLLQTIEVSRKSGVLEVRSQKGHGTMTFGDGQVLDAEVGPLHGERAVYRLLLWNEGDFEIEFRPVRTEAKIGIPTTALLMEGMRRVDEWGRLLEQVPDLATVIEVDTGQLAERLAELPDELNPLLSSIDGNRTLGEVVDLQRGDDLQTLTTLSKLFFEGLVEARRVTRTLRPEGPSSEDELVGAASTPVPNTLVPNRAQPSVIPAPLSEPAPRSGQVSQAPAGTFFGTPDASPSVRPHTELLTTPDSVRARLPTNTLPLPDLAPPTPPTPPAPPVTAPAPAGAIRPATVSEPPPSSPPPPADPAPIDPPPPKPEEPMAKKNKKKNSLPPRVETTVSYERKAESRDSKAPPASSPPVVATTPSTPAPASTPSTAPARIEEPKLEKVIVDPTLSEATTKADEASNVIQFPKRAEKDDEDESSEERAERRKRKTPMTESAEMRAIGTGEHAIVTEQFFKKKQNPDEPDDFSDLAASAPQKKEGEGWKWATIGIVVGALGLFGGYHYYVNHVLPPPAQLGQHGPANPGLLRPTATPTPTTPTPTEVAPTEVAPTEVAPTEVAPTEVAPTEVAPTEVAPTEVAPTEVAPTEVAPTEVAPTEVAPTEVAPAAGTESYEAVLAQANEARNARVSVPLYERAIELNPQGSQALSALAYILVQRPGRASQERARDLAQRAVQADPTDSRAWLSLGAAQELLGHSREARAAYDSCVSQGQGRWVRDCRASR